ncbi:Type III restriction enzyme, res subunit [Novosphingobium nitrogenifigens DSM 19370]|uniref:Type III restriction enzyme, res subunit n=1 Tax=Novosphingobium nitrogenifigens DSM 19370 TaxID=983920 RepID=F1ZCX3_9SPHN|nr:DEAD/DEAH box helicase family protein [Novosphingobium nitrogenifigens]EGD57540.1 Type III restriction enzyme, res subunit [Novosphingobium nitrogenifigens DSM 19370]
MQLKTYQTDTLATLRRFFEEARLRGPKAAYEAITQEPEQAKRLRSYGGKYEPLLGQEEMPYVCLRLPTGGGKTLLGAHAIGVAKDAWIEKDFPLVLWLVPTNMIRTQTADALNNPRHPYRQALDAQFGGRVRVFDIGDFARIRPHDLAGNCCIVVGTLQTLRVESTDGRKVYAHHEELEPLFSEVPKRAPGLEPLGPEVAAKVGGHPDDIRYSFANLCHLRQPLMIVDEAHKAVTGLSRTVQERVNPCAIVEFTATPHKKSNILHSVSALELKEAEMIKLPVRLEEHETWEGAVTGAILKRAELADEAVKDRANYIRPIVLFQAEDKNREVTVDVLRQHLIDTHHIDPKAIAVATGDQRDLDGIDLFKPDCPIEYVITVEALKEGWDCSFAYVFCSVANIKSSTDAEQLLGRVLRMPYAKRRKSAVLNKAYANLVSKSFAEAANTLRDRLVEMGFEESEAEANIEHEQGELDEGLWGERRRPKPAAKITVDASAEALAAVKAAAPEKVKIETAPGVSPVITVTGFLRQDEKERIFAALPEKAANVVREAIASHEKEHAHSASPAELGEEFVVPRLMAAVQGELVFAETDVLTEYFEWSLADHSAQLTKAEFDVRDTSEAFEIDLDGDHLLVRHSDQSDQLMLDVPVDGWTVGGLVNLLAKQVRQADSAISHGDMIVWLSDVVAFLTGPRAIPLATLMRCRFILARKLREKIAAIRAEVRKGVYQRCLFAPEAKPELSFDNGFRFHDGMFAGVPCYRGTKYRFAKHYLGWDRVPRFDGKGDDGAEGDEFKAAQQLDSIGEVEFWVRNVAKHPDAFWLPLAGGRTYPDFVAKLKDGRLLVVEYKGEHLVADSGEKRAIGELWQAASEGKGIYVFAEKERDGKNVKQQIQAAIG